MTAIVAVARDAGEVVGFAQVFSGGVFQVHLGLLAVGERMDLIGSDESLAFYRSFKHREQVGFRIYSDHEPDPTGR